MTFEFGIIIFISVFIFGLGILVYLNNHKNRTNKLFLATVCGIIVWMISNFLENGTSNLTLASIALRLDFFSASILSYFWLLFCLNFPQPREKRPWFEKVLVVVPAIFFAAMSFSDLIIKNITVVNERVVFDEGILFIFYAVYILAYMIIGGCGYLVFTYYKSKDIQRTQILYVLLGLSISGSIAVVINLFLQPYIPVELFRLGTYAVIFVPAFTAYAIVTKKLFNIKIVATELLALTLWIILLIRTILSSNPQDFAINLTISICVTIFGILLIKNVIVEVEQSKEIKKAYEIEKQAHQDLIELDEAKTNFMLVTQHHLRTPLSVTAGFMDLLIKGNYGKIDSNALDIIKRSDESIRKEIEVVNDLLTVSSFQLGKGYVQFEQNVPIKDILEDIVKDLKPVADNQKIYLKFESIDPIPNISADKKQIRMALQNIIDNAIKYTKQGGVDVKIKLEGDKVKIEIKDTGMGMTPEDQKELFKAFHRNKESWAANATGKGIGLFLTDQIIHAHSGKIWAESEGPGRGTIFSIELPINADLQSINKPLQVKSVNANI